MKRSFGRRANLRTKLLLIGVALTVIPLLVIAVFVRYEFYSALTAARVGARQLAASDLDHIAENTYASCSARQNDVLRILQVARGVLRRRALFTTDRKTVSWTARNQFTNVSMNLTLPRIRLGGKRMPIVSDPKIASPLVDEVHELAGGNCTLFQRMNAAGDMLRVNTNVVGKDGQRVIGTYIPAQNTNGEPNPVVASVLQKKTYVGRALVVDSWYMSAYEPILDSKGSVAGMLYVGQPESLEAETMRAAASKIGLGQRGSVFALHAAGAGRGQYLFSTDASGTAHASWDDQDADGFRFIQDRAQKALLLRPEQIAEARHVVLNPDGTRVRMITRLKYFGPWDWVIGVILPETEYLRSASQIDEIASHNQFWIVFVIGVSALLSLGIWLRFTSLLNSRLTRLVTKLQNGARKLAHAAQEIAAVARAEAQGASDQASSMENTAFASEKVNSIAQQNVRQSKVALEAISDAGALSAQALTMLEDMRASMSDIASANQKIGAISQLVNEIAFQTNLLALNASIEAARAGEAGLGFAVAADEVRNLSQRCSQAAQDTTALSNDCLGKSAGGSDTLAALSAAIQAMARKAETVSQLSRKTQSSSEEQALGVAGILEAVKSMECVVQQTAASAEETSAISEQLRSQAEDIRTQTSELAALVTGIER